MFGIQRALVSQSSSTLVALISGVAGVITEFIGATFLFLYRSTVQQAAENIKTLERINAVGMAVAILDSISPTSGDLRDRTKAELVRLLLNTVGQRE
jgi:hypothetical protein